MKEQQQQPQQKTINSDSNTTLGGHHRLANGSVSGVTDNNLMEDERDPDVIPVQFGNGDASMSHSEWTDPYLLEKFASHETRPNNLFLKPMTGTLPLPGHQHINSGSATMGRGVTMVMTTTSSGSGLNLHQQQPVTAKTGLNPYFQTGTYHPVTTSTTTTAGGRDSSMATTNLVVQNGGSGGDLDINVNVIKNMLLANRVPESCV